jgi:type VI secretion system protein VasG
MRVQPKLLVARLDPPCTAMLEAAVGRAAQARCYEIVPEHLLAELLAEPDGDAAQVLGHCGQDRPRLLARVERSLTRLATGNAGRPVFAEALFQWIEDSWTLASLQYGVSYLRPAHMLLQFIERGARYSAEEFAELEAIEPEPLRRELEAIVGHPHGPEPGDRSPNSGPSPAGPGARSGALAQFTVSLTEEARAGRIDPIFGRHREIRQLIDILARRRKNNPIIVGEPGVGKTALVEGLALAIVRGEVPELLRGTELLALDLGLLNAGASVKGEFERRLEAVIAEVRAAPRPTILFIDEAHTLIGSGGPKGGSDAANLLKPALARGQLRTIAATTWSEYKQYFEKDAALERRFQPVKCEEPSVADTIVMLRGLASTYEHSHGVRIRDEAVVAAAELSSRYIFGRQLPDKAVDLLDTAAARVKVEQGATPAAVEALALELAGLRRERDALDRDHAEQRSIDPERRATLDLAIEARTREHDQLRERWLRERDAVHRYLAARADATRTDTTDTAELEACARQLAELRGDADPLVHHECDADVVAQVVADWTGIPVGKMRADTISGVLELEPVLGRRVKGQAPAVEVVAETVRMAYAGVRDPDAPIGVLLFVGTSGVGKTEMALALADQLYGGERFMTTINMSEFQEPHSVSRLIGSPPGYVGFGEGGILTEAVRQRPYSVVLLDECEKAHPDVMNLFYQVFDKGVLADGEGRSVDFRNTLIILTSNLASDTIRRVCERERADSGDLSALSAELLDAIRPTLSAHFKPALLARMTVVPFRAIRPAIMREIAVAKLAKLGARLFAAHGLDVVFDDGLVDALVERCTDADSGARNLDHTLRASLMPAIAKVVLERLAEGQPLTQLAVSWSASEGWRVDAPAHLRT